MPTIVCRRREDSAARELRQSSSVSQCLLRPSRGTTIPMPLPKHVFDPPFNIVRASHVVLGVSDLERSLAFYQGLLGLRLEDRTATHAYLRGVEERQHHSTVLHMTEDPPACERIGFKVASE